MGYGRIQRISLTTTATAVDLSTAMGKVLLRVVGGDVRVGLDPAQMDGGIYFTIVDGSTVVLDQPTDLGGELHYFATGTGTATLELWLTSCGGAY
jgi:hypothetical protein